MSASIVRPENWPALLTAYVEAHRNRPFAWGRHDCGTFLADWVDLVAGYDPLAKVRGRYRSAIGWARVARNDGWADSAAVFDHALGPRIERKAAGRGDGGAIASPAGPVMGIVLGTEIVVPAVDGLVFVPVGLMVAAWRV